MFSNKYIPTDEHLLKETKFNKEFIAFPTLSLFLNQTSSVGILSFYVWGYEGMYGVI